MKIDFNKIIRPLYIVIFCIFVLILIFVMLSIDIYELKREIRWERDTNKFIKTEITERALKSENQYMLEAKSFYNQVINWYCEKPQSKKGMKKKVKSRFILKCYQYEKWLGLPHYTFISIAKEESAFNPNSKGKLGERGIFNIMPRTSTIGTAYGALMKLRVEKPWLSKEFEFYYTKPKDLTNPLNCLKIYALILWHYFRLYDGDMKWAIPDAHWGGRLYYYKRFDIPPPDEFVFNVGTIKEDARNPFTYYFVFEANWNAFRHHRKDVNIDKGWLDAYKKECSKAEVEFIEIFRTTKKLIDKEEIINEKIANMKKELDDVIKIKLKYNIEIKKLDKNNRKYLILLKQKKYKTIAKSIFLPVRIYFNEITDEITKKENKIRRRISAIISLVVICIILLCALGFIIIVSIWSFKKIRKRIKLNIKKIKNIKNLM